MTARDDTFKPTDTISGAEVRLLREFLQVSASEPAGGVSANEVLLTSLALALRSTKPKS